MLLLNYAHPLTDTQRLQLRALLGQEVAVRDIPVQADRQRPIRDVARDLADAAALTPAQWQELPLLINPPGLAPLAVALIAEVHGRSGHFPAVLNIRPSTSAPAPTYEVAEVVNLQDVRDQARLLR